MRRILTNHDFLGFMFLLFVLVFPLLFVGAARLLHDWVNMSWNAAIFALIFAMMAVFGVLELWQNSCYIPWPWRADRQGRWSLMWYWRKASAVLGGAMFIGIGLFGVGALVWFGDSLWVLGVIAVLIVMAMVLDGMLLRRSYR